MLINLRNALMAGKRLDVQNYSRWGDASLLSMFDGIRNRGATVAHDNSITTAWTDIVRDVDATGSFSEMTDIGPKATSGIPRLSFVCPISRGATAWTMELCFTTLVDTAHQYWCILANYESSGARFQINIEGNLRFHFITPSVFTVNSGITSDTQKKGTLAVAWDGSTVRLYWNGAYKAQKTMTSTQWYNTLRNSIATLFCRRSPSLPGYFGEPFWGTIHNCRMYSVSLTTDEIAANHAIDKERFNLP